MDVIKKIFSWFSSQWYVLLCISLLTFITLYPKIPLAEIIPGYIVRVRLEDIFVALVLGLFLVQLILKKVTLKTPLTKLFFAYCTVNILSMIGAVFLVDSVPYELLHIGKMVLHFARRFEYFLLFLFFYNAIKTFRHVRLVLFGLLFLVVGISAYGYGQKYLYWPVYSTMNREFSKGMRLVLTDHARVPSTFGGHYDMSAFLMFALIVVLSLFYFSKNWKEKTGLFLVFVLGFWLLILGSSRSSFLAYLLGSGVLILLISVKKWSIWWGISRGFLLFAFSIGIMVTFGDLSSRFSSLGIVIQTREYFSKLQKPVVEKPKDVIAINPVTETDSLPLPVKVTPVKEKIDDAPLPPDVYARIPDKKIVISTESGKSVSHIVEFPRIFSDCSYIYGLSACIRFETLWPRAINGFLRNPLFGSGPSTLTKQFRAEFTEAESTDNDFLRTLGELGLLGGITFYGMIFLFLSRALHMLSQNIRALSASVLIGLIAAILGLFLNGLYIDVFTASKVAFFFWSMMALGFRVIELSKNTKKQRV